MEQTAGVLVKAHYLCFIAWLIDISGLIVLASLSLPMLPTGVHVEAREGNSENIFP